MYQTTLRCNYYCFIEECTVLKAALFLKFKNFSSCLEKFKTAL